MAAAIVQNSQQEPTKQKAKTETGRNGERGRLCRVCWGAGPGAGVEAARAGVCACVRASGVGGGQGRRRQRQRPTWQQSEGWRSSRNKDTASRV